MSCRQPRDDDSRPCLCCVLNHRPAAGTGSKATCNGFEIGPSRVNIDNELSMLCCCSNGKAEQW